MTPIPPPLGPQSLERPPSWFLFVEGVLLILFGLAAIVFPIIAGMAAATFVGWILIACGLAGLFGAFAARPRMHFGWSLVSSTIAIAAGFVAAFNPLAGILALILVMVVWLILDGVSSMMIALALRRSGERSWVWSAGSAVVDWLLAVGLLVLGPRGGPLMVGVIVGIDLLLGGAALLAIGASSRGAAGSRARAP